MRKRIRSARRYAVLEMVLSVCLVVFPIYAIMLWRSSLWMGIGCLVLEAGAAAAAFGCDRLCRRAKREEPDFYRFPISGDSFEAVATALGCERLGDQGAFCACTYQKFTIRLLVIGQEEFLPEAARAARRAANREINRRVGAPEKLDRFRAATMMRINLIVCRGENEALRKWLSRNAEQLLRRTESIVQGAVDLRQGVCILPACPYGVLVQEIEKYSAACALLEEKLAEEKE